MHLWLNLLNILSSKLLDCFNASKITQSPKPIREMENKFGTIENKTKIETIIINPDFVTF